jgi:branched-chain amino acid transport system substrate-binding protein
MARAFPAARALAVVAVAGLALAACGDDEKTVTEPGPSTAASSAPVHKGDGTFKLGTLLPDTGSLAFTGPGDMAAVKLAIKEINDAGGVLGKPVTIESADSGDSKSGIAPAGADRLLGANVDVIVGANSSAVSKGVIPKITDAGVLQISPGNTSTDLSTFPDKGLYFRTAPSDVYQGRVVAETAAADGAETLGILAINDAYGTSLSKVAADTFKEAGGEVTPEPIIYDGQAEGYSAEVGKIKQANPDAILLISLGGEDSVKFLEEMVKQELLPLKKSGKKLYFVDGNMSNDIKIPAGTLEGVKGTLPGAEPQDDFKKKLDEQQSGLKDYVYVGESYDAVILTALAAEAAKSDYGPDIAAKMKDVSSGGQECKTYADCLGLLKDGKDIDYNGQSGPIEFDDNGDPSEAAMGIYQFGADNKYKPLKFVSGPIAGKGDSSSSSSSSGSGSGSTAEESPSPSPSAEASPSTDSEPSASPTP